MEKAYDLVIRGGTVVDGTGGQPFEADVGVKDGVIAASADRRLGAEEIDAAGQVVTPASSTSTPTTTARPPGTGACSPRPGTGSPPWSWATAASASPPASPATTTA
jgi:hypothetical protein